MCQQFPFTWGTKEGGGGRSVGGKWEVWGMGGGLPGIMWAIAVVYLYGTSSPRGKEEQREGKRIYCWGDGFIVPIKKRIWTRDLCLIAVEKPKSCCDANLQPSSLWFLFFFLFFFACGCGRSPKCFFFFFFNPIKETIIYVRARARRACKTFVLSESDLMLLLKWGE